VSGVVNAIETRRLSKRYGRLWALRDCTVSIPAGRSVALVGPNGAGKTTLLHLAVGLATPTDGHIAVLDGLVPGSDDALRHIAFVAQDTPLYSNLNVADMVRLTGGLSPGFDQRAAQRRLGALSIGLGQRVGRLSGGQQAQVALALARHPRLLILDEPVARLDPLARHEFMGVLMEAIAEEGISVVFSSHVVAELARVCDYLVVVGGGRLQVSGEVDQLLATHWLLTGPTAEADRLADSVAVIWSQRAERQTRLLARVSAPAGLPRGWEAERTNLEELVLCYLRSPASSAFDGPRPVSVPQVVA
jgi:ABC-2 type transport system ATP-binding protein